MAVTPHPKVIRTLKKQGMSDAKARKTATKFARNAARRKSASKKGKK